jgi:hypothetical protein
MKKINVKIEGISALLMTRVRVVKKKLEDELED